MSAIMPQGVGLEHVSTLRELLGVFVLLVLLIPIFLLAALVFNYSPFYLSFLMDGHLILLIFIFRCE